MFVGAICFLFSLFLFGVSGVLGGKENDVKERHLISELKSGYINGGYYHGCEKDHYNYYKKYKSFASEEFIFSESMASLGRSSNIAEEIERARNEVDGYFNPREHPEFYEEDYLKKIGIKQAEE